MINWRDIYFQQVVYKDFKDFKDFKDLTPTIHWIHTKDILVMNYIRIDLYLVFFQAKNGSFTRLLGTGYQGRKIKSYFDEETSKRVKNGSQERMLLGLWWRVATTYACVYCILLFLEELILGWSTKISCLKMHCKKEKHAFNFWRQFVGKNEKSKLKGRNAFQPVYGHCRDIHYLKI